MNKQSYIILPKKTLELSGEFIAGFVEGEGCFSINYCTSGPLGNKSKHLRPMFSLGLNVRDKPLLEKIQKTIGCGRIYLDTGNRKRYDKTHDCYSYRIYRYPELKNILIPFFEKYQFHGSKKIAFEIFKEIMMMVSMKAHLTKDGEQRLLELKTRLTTYDDGDNSEHE